MALNLDEVWLAENDDLDRIRRVARWVIEVLDLGNDPDQVNFRHRFTHQTRHDTETSDLDLELPIDDLIFQRSDQDLPPLVLVLRPVDDLGVLAVPDASLLVECVIVPESGGRRSRTPSPSVTADSVMKVEGGRVVDYEQTAGVMAWRRDRRRLTKNERAPESCDLLEDRLLDTESGRQHRRRGMTLEFWPAGTRGCCRR